MSRRRGARATPDLSLVLLVALLVILWLAGGASREDVAGQIISRAASWTTIIVAVLFARRPRFEEAKAPTLILLGAILLCVLQLVPLPPSMWRALPGRAAFADPLVSPPDLWRPLSIVPAATANALFSLVVPGAMLVLATGVREEQQRWILTSILVVIGLALGVGLLQVTGAHVINPLVNGVPGAIDGMMANRNHYALFLAIGLLIAPVWGVGGRGASQVRASIAVGIVLLFVLTILASGSRAGIALGSIALILGLIIVLRQVRSALRRYPRWVLPALCIGLIAIIAVSVLASMTADRAVSVNRLFSEDAGQDIRSRGLPTVLAMVRLYLPVGSGLGSFDPVFRLHEPFSLLYPSYFNHAHNDFLEVILTAGLPGLGLLAAAIGWWGVRSVTAWREEPVLPKIGSATLLLILLASLVDYPARTPMIMAVVTIAAFWLARVGRGSKAPLPPAERQL